MAPKPKQKGHNRDRVIPGQVEGSGEYVIGPERDWDSLAGAYSETGAESEEELKQKIRERIRKNRGKGRK